MMSLLIRGASSGRQHVETDYVSDHSSSHFEATKPVAKFWWNHNYDIVFIKDVNNTLPMERNISSCSTVLNR